MERLTQWVQQNRNLIMNSGALVGTALINSGLGFLYWWLAAKVYEQAVVGIASAVVSAMILLGSIAMLGLGTLLVGELSRRKGDEAALIGTSIAAVTLASIAAALIFAIGTTIFTHDFDVLTSNPLHLLLFVVGVILTALTLMLDQALIGLLRGEVQLRRNIMASIIKVVLLGLMVWLVVDTSGMWIFAAWVVSMVVSMVIPFRFLAQTFGTKVIVQLRLMRELGTSALTHHWLNLALDAPIRAMPVIVTILLSPVVNASFYIAWMMAGLLFFPVQSLTLVLFAVGAQDEQALAAKVRSTLRLSLFIAVVGYIIMFVTADLLMGVFGESYAAIAADALRIVCFASFPLIIKDHFVAIHRIHHRAHYAAALITIGGTMEIIFAAIGGYFGDVNSLSAAWVFAIVLQALYMTPSVLQIARLHTPAEIVSQT